MRCFERTPKDHSGKEEKEYRSERVNLALCLREKGAGYDKKKASPTMFSPLIVWCKKPSAKSGRHSPPLGEDACFCGESRGHGLPKSVVTYGGARPKNLRWFLSEIGF